MTFIALNHSKILRIPSAKMDEAHICFTFKIAILIIRLDLLQLHRAISSINFGQADKTFFLIWRYVSFRNFGGNVSSEIDGKNNAKP